MYIQSVRLLAAQGELGVPRSARASAALRAQAFSIACRLVFDRHTRRLERAKGHWRCASGIGALTHDCLEGFHDDVEAVVEYLFRHAHQPIWNLEGWLADRIRYAVVDGYRRRLTVGALQNPQVPQWLGAALADEAWLRVLAKQIMEWVGVSATAGAETWPLNAWAELRAASTGDWTASTSSQVAVDVERVLMVMRRVNPRWYAERIERPLGCKKIPVAVGSGDAEPVLSADVDGLLRELAELMLEAMTPRIVRGDDPATVVKEVFDMATACPEAALVDLDRVPHSGSDDHERVELLLRDEEALERLGAAVKAIVEESLKPSGGLQRDDPLRSTC